MFTNRRVVADADHFAWRWAPVLLRSFHLFIGVRSAGHIRAASLAPSGETLALLLQRAITKGMAAQPIPCESDGRLVKALKQLAPAERAAVVICRALSREIETAARVLGPADPHARRLRAYPLSRLHLLLSSKVSAAASHNEGPAPMIKERSL
jgi:hypothetical protein